MTSPTLAVRVLVSWDGTGTFTGPYDDVTADTAGDPGLAIDDGRDSGQTLAPPKVSAGSFELFNHTGRYSQHRADSPVYQRVTPGRPVAFRADAGTVDAYDSPTPYDESDPYDGVGSFDLGRHLLDEISQQTGWGAQRVSMRTLGHEVVLTDSVVSVPLQTNLRTDQCVTLLLDACGWPPAARSVGLSDTTLLYWWCDERRPWDALLELLGAEGPGTFYVDRTGVFHWEGRNYRTITPRSATSQATFADTTASGALYHVALTYDPGYHAIYNRASYATKRRSVGALAPVWNYGISLVLGGSESRRLFARPSDPFVGVIAPLAGTDYVVVSGSATVTLVSTAGYLAVIDVAAGPSGAVVNGVTSPGLQLRAQPLAVVSETVVQNNVDASASIARFSPIPGQAIPIPLSVSGWPEVDPAMATAVCNAWVNRYKEPRAVVTVGLRNADSAHLVQVLARMVSDRVTLVEANTGLHDDAWINTAELRIFGAHGTVLEASLGCELCDTLSGAVWNTAVWNDPAAVWGI